MSIKFTAKGKSAEILLYDDIGASFWGGGVSAKMFADELKALGSPETIDVRINSYGGEVFDGLSMHRLLVEHPATIAVHVDGIAASIASVIAMAGDTIAISESGRMMIHDAATIAMGNAAELRRAAELVDSTSSIIADLYAARSGATAEKMRELMLTETWLTAQEAIDNKLADSISENIRVAADGRFRPAPAWAASLFQKMPKIIEPPTETEVKAFDLKAQGKAHQARLARYEAGLRRDKLRRAGTIPA